MDRRTVADFWEAVGSTDDTGTVDAVMYGDGDYHPLAGFIAGASGTHR